MKFRNAKDTICDSAGFYDEFTRADLVAWFPKITAKMIDNVIARLIAHGVLQRVSRGTYRWV